jgi:MYXO-CTERM domain-containing protein
MFHVSEERDMKRCLCLVGAVVCASALSSGSTAYAHINMVGALQSRGGDEKAVPCDGQRADGPTYTFEPGATITLGVNEAVKHPSYFRIAFDDSGEDAFVEPASIDPIDPNRAGQGKKCLGGQDKCGKSDFCNVVSTTGASVLWDNLDPHLADKGGMWTWTVKLPQMECDNCTIQVIQVMEDTVHGAYCPLGSCAQSCSSIVPGLSTCSDGSAQDLYHRCINVKLKKGAGTSGPGNTSAPVVNKGIDCLANMSSPDAGVRDAGTPGAMPSDAGPAVEQDAGAVVSADAGAATAADSGLWSTDAGPVTVGTDGGAPGNGFPPPGTPDAGVTVDWNAEGCACSVDGRRQGGPWTAIAMALLFALDRRRRRRA